MDVPEILNRIFKYVDEHKSSLIEQLSEIVQIRSVSGWEKTRAQTCDMVYEMANKFRLKGYQVFLRDVGVQHMSNGKQIPLPPILLAQLGNDDKKKTICFYNYLDVQSALLEDGWNTDPFTLVERDGKLYGRGTSDNKAAVLCCINAVEGYLALGVELPVNIKFLFEAMQESGSPNLSKLIEFEKDKFLSDVDYVCVCGGYWPEKEHPCIIHGLKGYMYFYVEVKCASRDLHSGTFGGCIYEGMSDLIYLLNTLVDKEGIILIPDVNKNVAATTLEELTRYAKTNFNLEDFKKRIGAKRLPHSDDKVQFLTRWWNLPSLSIHGIEGCYNEQGEKMVIPGKVTGKFSVRLVPNQTTDEIKKLVLAHLNEKWKLRDSPNQIKITVASDGSPWLSDPSHPHYSAAQRAYKYVYKKNADFIYESGSITPVSWLQEILKKNIIILPITSLDCSAHAQDEFIEVVKYLQGVKLIAAYFYEVSLMS
ncbi:hypothetical protein FQR65_LT15482 [Abscondita terminalis]|nr:hypothetical protein FQR65_LT15482 [Abscondita terminalis]